MKNKGYEVTSSHRSRKTVSVKNKLSKSIVASGGQPAVIKEDKSMMEESVDYVGLTNSEKPAGTVTYEDCPKLVNASAESSLSKPFKETIKESIENANLTNSDSQAGVLTYSMDTSLLVKSDEEQDTKEKLRLKLSSLSTESETVSADRNTDEMPIEWDADALSANRRTDKKMHVTEDVSETNIQTRNISTQVPSDSANVMSESNESYKQKRYPYKQKRYQQPEKSCKKYLKERKAEEIRQRKSRTMKIRKSCFLKQWKKRKKSVKFRKKLKNVTTEENHKKDNFRKKSMKTKGWSWNIEESWKEKYITEDVNALSESFYKQSKEITMMLRAVTELLHHQRSWTTSIYVYPTRRKNRGNRRNRQGRTDSSQAAERVQDEKPIQVSDADHENLCLPPAELVVTSARSTFHAFSNNVPSPTPSSMVSIDSERNLRSRLRGELPDNRFSRVQEPAKHPEYSDQPSRQRSFTNWPSTTGQDPSRMAVYGFFYTGRIDLIRCYMCGIGLKDWAGADEPLFEHIKHSPNCMFLKDLLGEDLLSAYRDNLRANQVQQATNPATSSSTGNEARAPARVRNPQYREVQARLHTFDRWPASAKQSPQALAEAGLFYTGTNDLCRCYSCDGGLQRWDADDDPWIEHARWFQHCQFMKDAKGQEYIDMVQQAAAQARAEEEEGQASASQASGQGAGRSGPVEQELSELSLQNNTSLNSAARVAVGLGYSRRAVRLAIQEFNQQAPVGAQNDYSSGDLTRILREMESRGVALPPDSPTDAASASVLLPSDLDPEEENRRLRGILRCMVCQENDTNILFLPCTHHRMCEECAEKVVICPVCGTKIAEKIKTYLS